MKLMLPRIVCSVSDLKIKLSKTEHFHFKNLPEVFTITCHAGSFRTKANSVYSVRAAVEWGADIVEFDVSFRPDGTPVIIHNPSPGIKEGVLLEKALDEVAKSDKCRINLDIKSTANLPAVDMLVSLKRLEKRVFYTGVFEDWVDTVRNSSSIPYYINYNPSKDEAIDPEYIKSIVNKAIELGAIGINSNFTGVSQRMVDAAHKSGLLVSLWTANSIPDMLTALALCPDNITTKKPNVLKNLIK